MPCTLVTGPVRSGKSRFAESLARTAGRNVTYVATGRIDPDDAEWVARLARHAATRPPHWRLVETARPGSADLATIVRAATLGEVLLIESLGTWLAERMTVRLAERAELGAGDATALEDELAAVIDAVLASTANVIVVGEETGWGIVPLYASARLFRDVLGRGHQRLAGGASAAYLVVAGFALDLGALGTRIPNASEPDA